LNLVRELHSIDLPKFRVVGGIVRYDESARNSMKNMGEAGFAVIKRAILIEIETTFKIQERSSNINRTIELARERYLHQDLHPEETIRI
jgi:hypothetical protein